MNLYLIRHTTPDCPKGICYGQSDLDISTDFHEEKEAVLKKLNGVRFDKLYSSPLKRTKILAEAINKNTSVIFDDRLKELNFGEWELKSWDEIYASAEGKKWFDDYFLVSCPGGESYNDLMERVLSFYDECIRWETDNNVVVVAHGGVLRALKSIVENRSAAEVFAEKAIPFGEVVKYEINHCCSDRS